MPTAADQVARQHQRDRQRLTAIGAAAALRAWGRVDSENLARSWAPLALGLTAIVTGLQRAAATTADVYVDEALGAQDLEVPADGAVAADAFAGIASDGRPLRSLLQQPAITTLSALGTGAPIRDALRSGGHALGMIVTTQVADAGRAADGVAITARQGTGYVRAITTPSCSRCAVLAGRVYRASEAFDRHPRCDCIHVPVAIAAPKSAATDVNAYFDSLTAHDQDQIFTTAGAAAIREGADINQVVNARRGMTPAGTTFEASRSGRRLMPESIYARAGGDRDRAVALLHQHGYLL